MAFASGTRLGPSETAAQIGVALAEIYNKTIQSTGRIS